MQLPATRPIPSDKTSVSGAEIGWSLKINCLSLFASLMEFFTLIE
jgi:hypothetical protein